MQRLKWLFEDAVSHNPLPFSPFQTRLQLLGFLLPDNQRYPAPLEMVTETGGKRFSIGHTGYATQMHGRQADWRQPDIAAPAGASLKMGEVAYAISREHIVVGQEWEVRRELRAVLKDSKTPPTTAMAILEHLQAQPKRILMTRAFEQGGWEAYNNADCWLGLRERIKTTTASRNNALKSEMA